MKEETIQSPLANNDRYRDPLVKCECLVGKRFGRLQVISRGPDYRYRKKWHPKWNCKCDCGKDRLVFGGHLRNGVTTSCGCNRTKHGFATVVAENASKPVYAAWRAIHNRCYNPSNVGYHLYGGRGITVCERWFDLENFLFDMLPGWKRGLSIDRIDNSKGYSPDNCRWATRKEQQRNLRSNVRITVNGVTKCMIEWTQMLGGSESLISNRLRMGWSLEKAASTPLCYKKSFPSVL